jgi:exodeoxyribonuclease V beta subunit
MKQFNVLTRHLALHQHYLLEASAGTGKTFSIQNIVVRLLIEPFGLEEPLLLNKILVVTFTRAATRDLKLRIRANIEQALNILQKGLLHQNSDKIPDYLQAILEKKDEIIQEAKKRLQQALHTFDQAQIFTIHAFCARLLRHCALEGDVSFQAIHLENSLPPSEILSIVHDFFRTEMRLELYSPAQLEIILKEDPDQRKLLRIIQRGYDLVLLPTYQELYFKFVTCMQQFKKQGYTQAEQVLADFNEQASSYRNYKSGETKTETLQKVKQFAQLFEQTDWTTENFDLLIKNDLVWVKALDPKLLKNKQTAKSLHYPQLTQELSKNLLPLVEIARDFSILLARLAKDCQKLLYRYQREEEKLSPDDLLRKMDKALDQPYFLDQVQSCYQAAIIDEFQDTDPLQWNIFRRLFLVDSSKWKGYLYLVGDPKQSIYSFRQADIYTYLAAAQALGDAHWFSLDVNYRSQPHLVQALNTIFDETILPSFIALPKKNIHLIYQPVKAASHQAEWLDTKGALHFFIADGKAFQKSKLADLEIEVFFPFIAQEIDRLIIEKKMNYHQFAILVRDRHQALRLANYFDRFQLPYVNQRGTSLADSAAISALINVIRAVLNPQDQSILRTALGSPLMGWNYEILKNSTSLEFVIILIQKLHHLLIHDGFAPFFHHLLHSSCHVNGKTVLEQLLAREGGIDFYHDIQQIANCIIDHHYREWNSPEGIIPFLDQFQEWEQNEDERVKRFQDPTKDGVKILTLHFSKGLEFEVVFALGLVNRTVTSNELIPIETQGKILLTPLNQEAEKYYHYCEENDAEKMRQLYVALTRAKLQLYIPIALHLPSNHLKIGEASPIDLFLSRFAQNTCSYDNLYERIREQTGYALIQWLKNREDEKQITFSIHQSIDFKPLEKQEKIIEVLLISPPKIHLTFDPLFLTSFSTLSRQIVQKNSEKLEKKFQLPNDFKNPVKTIETLPAGPETGVIIHQLLERLNFRDFRELQQLDQAIKLVRPYLQKTQFKEWEAVLAALIFHVLKTPLLGLTQTFCLADLSSQEMYREVNFLFPHHMTDPIEGITYHQGLIKGVIDLVFSYQGMYYLVDWKSHWLGPSIDDYHQAALQAVMQNHHYFLQAAIYQKALERYLKVVESRPFFDCFGGTFYLFLRGLNPEQTTGIYFMEGQSFTLYCPEMILT